MFGLFKSKDLAEKEARVTEIGKLLFQQISLVSCQSRIVISTAGRNLRFLSREDSFEMTEYR